MAGIAGSTGLAKVMMPVPDPHPDVFDRVWPLRVADILGGHLAYMLFQAPVIVALHAAEMLPG